MKKFVLLSALAAFSLSATAAVPFAKGVTAPRKAQPRVSAPAMRAAEAQEILNEDFSKFSAGSETAPADEITYENSYYIPQSYTKVEGWTGQGVRPAGGSVALYGYTDDWDEERHGYISTPKMMMGGTATLTFRARALEGEASLWTVLCDDDYGPGYDELDATLTTEWQNFELVAVEGSLELPSYFQFSAEAGVVLIDDVRIMFKQDRISAPYAYPAVNVSPTEFQANWDAVPGAERYLLNVLCKTLPEKPVTGVVSQNFDGINATAGKIDAANPGYPEGWTINVSAAGSQDVAVDAADMSSAPVALKFDAVGDVIESPVLPLPLSGLSFWVKPSAYDDDYYGMSLLRVDIHHTTNDSWEGIANIPYYYVMEGGGVYEFPSEALGDDVDRVKISMLQRGAVDFYIDDVNLEYADQGTVSSLLKDFAVEGTSYNVKDINPTNEYSYYVQAVMGDVVSATSYVIWVDGIAGLPVIANEPANVENTSFTASWNKLGHATDYTVDLYRLVEPATDLADVVVIEEDFDAIDEGTVDQPGTDWISPLDFSSKGWCATSWSATQPAWAAGMAGTTGTNAWMGTAGLVYSPLLDLSCYAGPSINVDATVYTTVDSFEFNSNSEKEGIYAMIMKTPYDTAPIASGYFETGKVGLTEGRAVISNVPADADLSSVIIAFMNKSGLTFFVDKVKITMNVPAGKTLMTPLQSATTQETSHTFTGLDGSVDHAYMVTASTTRNYETYTSKPSENHVARTSTGVSDVVADGSEIEVTVAGGEIAVVAADNTAWTVYNVSGVAVASGKGAGSAAVAPGIYIVAAEGSAVKVAVK